jgi:hypothetical protein
MTFCSHFHHSLDEPLGSLSWRPRIFLALTPHTRSICLDRSSQGDDTGHQALAGQAFCRSSVRAGSVPQQSSTSISITNGRYCSEKQQIADPSVHAAGLMRAGDRGPSGQAWRSGQQTDSNRSPYESTRSMENRGDRRRPQALTPVLTGGFPMILPDP